MMIEAGRHFHPRRPSKW